MTEFFLYRGEYIVAKILVIDDYPQNVALIQTYFLGTKHNFISANNGASGLDLAYSENPDIILLDILMPGLDGFEVCHRLQAESKTASIPIIMISGLADNRSRAQCFELGVQYLNKPFNVYEIKQRVEMLLEMTSYKRQLKSAEELIFKLALIAENKDAYAAGSSRKGASLGVHFASALGLDDTDIRDIGKGGLLQAVGKIEINENILSKPGPLTSAEFEQIKKYPIAGERICQPIESLKNVLPIIRSHQEKHDGSGYPDNLGGDDIPLPAQIISLSGTLNALITDRPYRQAMTFKDALDVMADDMNDGKFDPELFKEFNDVYKDSSTSEIDDINLNSLLN